MKPKPIKQTAARKHAITLHARIVRHRTPHCQAATNNVLTVITCVGPLQCAHIIPKRGATAIATHLDNAWTLCAGHHRYVDRRPDGWLELVQATCGTQFVADLRAEALEADQEGMPLFAYGDGGAVRHVVARTSKLHFWRAELHRMVRTAHDTPRFTWGTTPLWVQRIDTP